MSLCMLLLLKEYIVRCYGLTPERITAFASATAEKRKQVRALPAQAADQIALAHSR